MCSHHKPKPTAVLLAFVLSLGFATPAKAITPGSLQAKRNVALVMSFTLDEPVEAALFAAILAEIACDPDPCRIVKQYRIPVQPRMPDLRPVADPNVLAKQFSGSISSTTVRLYQNVTDATWAVSAYELAVFEAVCRRYTAKVKKDTKAQKTQEKHLRHLIIETGKRKKEANMAWQALLDHFKQSGIAGHPISSIEPFINKIRENGFPPEEIEMLRGFGLSTKDIERVRLIAIEPLDAKTVPKSFEEAAQVAIQINEHNEDIEKCKCAEQ